MLEKILTLRPTNAVARLGDASMLPLLNPRDLVRALEKYPASLLTVPVLHPKLVAPALRAARDADAALGLAFRHGAERERVGRLLHVLRDAAAETGHQRPVFVQAGPFSIGGGSSTEVEVARGDVYRAVDGGASLIVLDASGADPDTAGNQCAEIAASAIERELALELTAPGSPDELKRLLDGMRAYGAGPLFVRLTSARLVLESAAGTEPVIDFEQLEGWKAAAAAFDAHLSIEDVASPMKFLSSWTAAQVRKVDLHGRLARVVLNALPPGARAELEADPIQQLSDSTSAIDALGGRALDRLEAMVFSELLDAFESVGALKSSSRSIRFLAEHAGY